MDSSGGSSSAPASGDTRGKRRWLRSVTVVATIFVAAVIAIVAIHYVNQATKHNATISDATDSVGKIYAATQVGTNFTTYANLLIDAQASVNRAEQEAPKSEVTASLKEIVGEYYDAARVWEGQVSGSQTYLPDQHILIKYNVLSPSLMHQYNVLTRGFVDTMKTNPEDGTEALRKVKSFILEHQLDADSIMQKVWADAAIKYKRVSESS